ncbi:four-helix bundle copper-binding protein [Methylorubrum populi]|uniref:Four-helix bundle copper-binding protein n=1 Tax=Methylorubrum rhodesianum TaxID=29427 RepID=A0ABU9Z501_9HYPH|nr:four-helix bundle copper-binding protein [Methylorubrum rhodesianum]MBK3404078.1 four-helix bundle copper-binding protein [Methylorubrum rhodesianum]MBY0143381.1 four-helix bundle copper-binding protein [Methylorubrum populi]
MQDRRWVVGSGLAFAAAGMSVRLAEAQQPGAMPGMGGGAMTIQECVDSCLKSHTMCLDTGRYCMEQGGRHVAAAHLALLLDCAEMCQTTANSLLRRSPQHAVVCEACARLCEACARDCEGFAPDPQMQRCARTCQDCARSCRDMAKMPL